jgi:hypothetical protein
MKICSLCKIEKTLNEFHNCSKSKNGKKFQCKVCVKENNKKHYLNNREKLLERSNKSYLDNREQKIESHRKWKQKNIEKSKTYNIKYQKERRKIDPIFQVSCNLRSRISKFYKGVSKAKKNRRDIRLLIRIFCKIS